MVDGAEDLVGLPAELRDNEDARELQPNGTYALPPRAPGEPAFSAQRYFMASANLRAAQAAATAV